MFKNLQCGRLDMLDRFGYRPTPLNFTKHFNTSYCLISRFSILELCDQNFEFRRNESQHLCFIVFSPGGFSQTQLQLRRVSYLFSKLLSPGLLSTAPRLMVAAWRHPRAIHGRRHGSEVGGWEEGRRLGGGGVEDSCLLSNSGTRP